MNIETLIIIETLYMVEIVKKKWSRGKSKEKTNNLTSINKEYYKKILQEISKIKILTPFILSEKFHLSYSLSKKILNDLSNRNISLKIKKLKKFSVFYIDRP
ncbi:40S ribosomal protein S25 (nucleomorph) [Cryptomonas paramecium]|uniref:40S ribosomal protein S25 n=1 Tax=Cryptomonas paramaecium TaxID=2898 RepID=F2HHT9_9CRYP|nr:40S ribosomal protein S25 [Cryptomonas paramecium]AEA38885.1 40S ribosomal protein S25 [Cryptomonas paramecium]|mmetsp:Transcript_88802/g.236407  ORF Transcript_88802/g.236407 Transcript_88802/m.236407 type:complete len:102 (-) Transcript_88802:2917-3222(-)